MTNILKKRDCADKIEAINALLSFHESRAVTALNEVTSDTECGKAAAEAAMAITRLSPPNLGDMAVRWSGSRNAELRNHALHLLPEIITSQSFQQLLIDMAATPDFAYSKGLHAFVHQNIQMVESQMLTAILNAKSVEMQYLAAVELLDSNTPGPMAYENLIPALLRVLRMTEAIGNTDYSDSAEKGAVANLLFRESRRRLDQLITKGLNDSDFKKVLPFVTGSDTTARYATRILLCTDNESILKEIISKNPPNECEGLFDESSELYFSTDRRDITKTRVFLNPENKRWIANFLSSTDPRNRFNAARIMAGFGDSDCIKTALDLVGIRESIPKYGFFGPDVEIRPYFKEAVLVLDELLDANVTPYKANHLVQFLTIDDDHIKKTMIDSIKTRVLKIIAKSGDDMAIEKLFESYPEGASFIAYDRLDFLSRHLDKTDQFFVVRAMTNARDEHHKKFFDTLLKRISKNENIPQ